MNNEHEVMLTLECEERQNFVWQQNPYKNRPRIYVEALYYTTPALQQICEIHVRTIWIVRFGHDSRRDG